MCGNLFRSKTQTVETPKVEQVAPAPTPISPTDATATADAVKEQNKKKRQAAAMGFEGTRSRSVLTDEAAGGKQTLG